MVAAGGLVSLGTNFPEAFRQAGDDPNGEKPENLPVTQVTMMDLLINIKTAKSLGHYPNPRCLPRLPSRLDSLEGISLSQVSSTAPVHLFNSHLRMQPRDWLRSRVPLGSAHGTCPNSADALRIVVRPFD